MLNETQERLLGRKPQPISLVASDSPHPRAQLCTSSKLAHGYPIHKDRLWRSVHGQSFPLTSGRQFVKFLPCMELKGQECLEIFLGKLPTWLEALLDRLQVSLSLWIAALAGVVVLLDILLGWTSLSVRFSRFLKGRLNAFGNPQHTPPDEIVIQNKAVTNTSEKLEGCKLTSSSIQIDDLVGFYQKLHYTDGGPSWQFLAERSIPGMTYQAWRRDPQEGPTEYRSRFVFENVTPQLMRDFLWDDELRHEWDTLIKSAKCVEGCADTGENITHWIKKFPFFCSDREYVMVRRIYECEGIFYCITKASSHKEIPISKVPRRVQVYTSNWCIQAVESSQTGQRTSCEVTFLHSEDLLIQRDLAKLGVRRAMWPLVKRMEPGLRKYQAYSRSSSSPSLSSSLARVYTSVPSHLFNCSTSGASGHEGKEETENEGHFNCSTSGASGHEGKEETENQGHFNACKWVLIGGALFLACGMAGVPVARVVVVSVANGVGRFKRRR